MAEVEPQAVLQTDVVITTADTLRHMEVLRSWLHDHRPLILCGPPGSGKTMTLQSTLKSLTDFEVANLNFSSATTPELILTTFDQYCEYKPTPSGTLLRPTQPGKWLVVFCDEINLPAEDDYGTQRVITFLRQLTEQGGFWRLKGGHRSWVTLERIQFVGACNPPTDPGRVPLSARFLRHAPLLLVDFPGPASLRRIYGTFNRALLKMQPPLRGYGDPLTEAMVEFYAKNQARFTPDAHPHYIYSPRELSKWTRALYEGIEPLEAVTLEALVRLFLHEGLRLFCDRLVDAEDRDWCSALADEVALRHFPAVDPAAITRPLLFSKWLSRHYADVDRNLLRQHVQARLHVFYEEELNVPLVVFDSVLDHALRIERVLSQPLGHVLLVGESGAGKTVLSRFVAWMEGLSVFQVKASRRYSLEDFDDDLRHVLRRTGVDGEKLCFIFDESNVLDAAFLERMNALLASGEVPGLFEGDDKTSLMNALKDASSRESFIADSEEDLFRWFTKRVQRHLHIVFTMNPASADFGNRAATSPALFNRCVVNWVGDWDDKALAQVAHEFTAQSDLDDPDYKPPTDILASQALAKGIAASTTDRSAADGMDADDDDADDVFNRTFTYRDAVVSCLVRVHRIVRAATERLGKRTGRRTFVSPRDYLDLIQHYRKLYESKRRELEDQQVTGGNRKDGLVSSVYSRCGCMAVWLCGCVSVCLCVAPPASLERRPGKTPRHPNASRRVAPWAGTKGKGAGSKKPRS